MTDPDAEDPVPPAPAPDAGQDTERERVRALVRARLFGGPIDPLRIDRFVVLERLGAGATGIVYEAYDPRLDRKVALKRVRPAAQVDPARDAALAARLVREAQALARLAHPNVVTVHDVVTVNDAVYVAMERVSGEPLRAWAAAARPWRQVLDVLIGAGRGLAAAHAAGLVHRDVKPDNVLVDTGGSARVVDFGLVRLAEGSLDPVEPAEPSGDASPLEGTITRTGALLGTPGYIAPEVHQGGAADARSDQFSFCVTAYESLCGVRPFRGDTIAEVSEAAVRGEVAAPEPGRRVPGPVRRVLLRGLRAEPSARYPDMPALLAELTRARTLPRRRAAIALATAALAGGFAFFALRPGSPDACALFDEPLRAVWAPPRAAAIRNAFLRVDPTHGPAAAERAIAALGGYADSWSAMAGDSCRATHVRRVQSADLLDRRSACLEARIAALRATVTLLADPDSQVVLRADEIVGSLPPIERCGDLAALLALVPPPRDAATRARVAAVDPLVAEARAHLAAARLVPGIEVARRATEAANAVGHRPLESEAWLVLGTLLHRHDEMDPAADALARAVAAAEAAGHVENVARAAAELVHVSSNKDRLAEADRWGRLARAAAERATSDPVQIEVLLAEGQRLQKGGDAPGAVRAYRAALSIVERHFGGDTLDAARALDDLGGALHRENQLAEAEAIHRRALAIRERIAGPQHPAVADSLVLLATTLTTARRMDEALPLLDRAIALREAALGSTHTKTSAALYQRGRAHYAARRHDQALADLERARDGYAVSRGPQHTSTLAAIELIAGIYFRGDQYDRAKGMMEQVIEARAATLGANHPQVARGRSFLGSVLFSKKRPDEAIVQLERALAILDAIDDKDYIQRVSTLSVLAMALQATGEARRALPHAERAQAMALEHAPSHVAGAEMALAMTLWDLGEERKRALELARSARDRWRSGGDLDNAEQADAWLSDHRALKQ